MKVNKYKNKKSTWITQGLLASIRHRYTFYKQIKLTNPDSPEHEMLLSNLRTYNVILKMSFRIAKQSYFETRFNQLKFDIKNTWKTINEILSKSKTNKSFPTYFKESNYSMTDKLEIAIKCNACFTNIGNHLENNIKYKGFHDHLYYLNQK